MNTATMATKVEAARSKLAQIKRDYDAAAAGKPHQAKAPSIDVTAPFKLLIMGRNGALITVDPEKQGLAHGFENSGSTRYSKTRRAGYTLLALNDSDTEKPLATYRVDFDDQLETVLPLQQVVVAVDVATGPIELQCGQRIIAAISRVAESVQAAVCAENGAALSDIELTAIATAIDDQMLKRRRAIRPLITRLPDGTVRAQGPLSFLAQYETPRGRHIETRYFECEPAEYFEGQIRGMEMARELLTYFKTHKQRNAHVDLRHIVAEATTGKSEWFYQFNSVDRLNVVAGFVDILADIVPFFAEHANFERWIDGKIASIRTDQALLRRLDAEARTAFVERMRKAKAAKKAEGEKRHA